MCCPSGVCGAAVDPELSRVAADLDWLRGQGVTVERFNLAQEPGAFAEDRVVRAFLQDRGADHLPLVLVDGSAVAEGAYPSREVLAREVGLVVPEPFEFDERVEELVALGAAMAANCEVCFRYHFEQAHKLGLSRQDMLRACSMGSKVRNAAGRAISDLAKKCLHAEAPPPQGEPGCCGSPRAGRPSCC